MNKTEQELIAKASREWHEHPFVCIQVSMLMVLGFWWMICAFGPGLGAFEGHALWMFGLQAVNVVLSFLAHKADTIAPAPPAAPAGG
jgi:hypothetical protein